MAAYVSAHGGAPKQAAFARSSGDTPVVGYAVGFDDGGVPHYYSVTTGDPARVDERHETLDHRVQLLREELAGSSVASESFSVSPQSQSWEFEMAIYAGGGASSDAGSISHNVELKRLTNDGTSDGETFAAIQTMTAQPEAYSNLSGDTWHDWSPAENSPGTESQALIDYGPEASKSGDGTKSATLSARGTPLSWSWEHDGDVTTESDTSANEADMMHGDFHQSYGGGTGDLEEEMGCGTAIETNQPSSGYYDLATLSAEETFFYANGYVYDQRVISDEQTLSVDYEYL
ncbi:hypothetical protein [Haloarchaeobius sp. DYHT-AS-18]|uniref:hypothetical protein n=1 Tax=Haloarchaeobius sp. DYHT-AS-18 TaxID=3446117 RepID=UPI003EBBCA1E